MSKDIELGKAVSQRLKNLRKVAGVTRKELEKKHDVKCPSLISWEKGDRIPRKDNAENLAAAFKKYGIPCTADWILEGKGSDPLEIAAQKTEESYILQEVYRFEASHKDAVIMQVEDQHMSPWINEGDFVGGVYVDQKDRQRFVDHICIVRIRDFGTRIRLVQKTANDGLYNLVSFSSKGNILNVELEAVARIMLLRKL